jgi:hypothetical protein
MVLDRKEFMAASRFKPLTHKHGQAKANTAPRIVSILQGIVLVVIIVFLVMLLAGGPAPQSTTPVDEQSYKLGPFSEVARGHEQQGGKAQVDRLLNAIKAYEVFLASAEKDFKINNGKEADLDKVRAMLVLIDAMADSLNNARLSKQILSKDDVTYVKGIEKRLSTFQKRMLPGLRISFKERSRELLWEHDIYVRVYGKNNTIVEFSGAVFAANANIKSVHEQVGDVLQKLRFKQARFKWYKGANEYTYYDLTNSPADETLTFFRFGSFQPMATGY